MSHYHVVELVSLNALRTALSEKEQPQIEKEKLLDIIPQAPEQKIPTEPKKLNTTEPSQQQKVQTEDA